MGFLDAVKTCLRKYFIFHGRAQRSEFWFFYLFTIIVSVIAAIIDGATFGWETSDAAPLGIVTTLTFLIPTLSAAWRRLHDTGRSGWWIGGGILLFIAFIILMIILSLTIGFTESGSLLIGIVAIVFFIGVIVYLITILVFLCQDSYPGDNVYGRSTKYDSGSSVFD